MSKITDFTPPFELIATVLLVNRNLNNTKQIQISFHYKMASRATP